MKSFTFGRIVGNRGAFLRSAGRILWILMASGLIGPSGLTRERHVSPLRQPSPSRSISTKATSMMTPGAPQAKGCLRINSSLLGRVIGETDADQRSQDQRQEKGEQPRHLTNDAARLAAFVQLPVARVLRLHDRIAASRYCSRRTD